MLWTVSISQLSIVSTKIAPTVSGQDTTTQDASQTTDGEYYSDGSYPAVFAKVYLSCVDSDSITAARKNIENAIQSDEVRVDLGVSFKSPSFR